MRIANVRTCGRAETRYRRWTTVTIRKVPDNLKIADFGPQVASFEMGRRSASKEGIRLNPRPPLEELVESGGAGSSRCLPNCWAGAALSGGSVLPIGLPTQNAETLGRNSLFFNDLTQITDIFL